MFRKRIEKRIANTLSQKFPGSKWRVRLDKDFTWDIEALPDSKMEFYDQYPNLSKKAADEQILVDIESIVKHYLWGAELTSYERDGQYVDWKR